MLLGEEKSRDESRQKFKAIQDDEIGWRERIKEKGDNPKTQATANPNKLEKKENPGGQIQFTERKESTKGKRFSEKVQHNESKQEEWTNEPGTGLYYVN